MSRSIHVPMKRMLNSERVTPLREGRTGHLEPLFRKAARWAKDNADELRKAEPELPAPLYGRAADNWRPLIAVADQAGGAWPKEARCIAEKHSGRYDDLAHVMVLHDVLGVFKARAPLERLSSSDIVEALREMEERPWPEWKQGRPITPRQLAKLLDPFGVVPVTVKLIGGKTSKGYHKERFEELAQRYPLDPPPLNP
jgi:Protein of unknown function (DUF3631)